MNALTPAALMALLNGESDNFMAACSPNGIEKQEAAGQQDLLMSDYLPRQCLYCTKEQLEAMGIRFGDDIDDLFVSVTLPSGWTKQATDQSMWSDLVDDKGRIRASIFYKAAFYDKNAHISLQQRFSYSISPCDAEGEAVERSNATHGRVTINDKGLPTNCIIHTVGIYERDDYQSQSSLFTEAKAWLNENYPDWKDPMAYWD